MSIHIRAGKPAAIQELARFPVTDPSHCGVARMLRRLAELAASDKNFADVKIDCHREFWEATRLEDFDSAVEKAISTIQKAKGLECNSVILMPCAGPLTNRLQRDCHSWLCTEP
jgi:hypothetical protein